MTMKTKRNIVKIDEEKCDGCGACIISCTEGALEIINGKARLVSEKYCDGLGNCLDCPRGAISIETREAEIFDESAVDEHLKEQEQGEGIACRCPSAKVERLEIISPASEPPSASMEKTASRLGNWPVQLTLVPPTARFLDGADVVLAGDCVTAACPDFHHDFLGERKALLVACPKLDDFQRHQDKLTEILKMAGIRSLTVLHMEVPCCSGLVHMARQAILASGNVVPFRDITIGTRGEVLSDQARVKAFPIS